MIQQIKFFIEDLRMQWDEMMWKFSDERKELASLRLAAHNLSLKEGRVSPYIDPEAYTGNWIPKTKLR